MTVALELISGVAIVAPVTLGAVLALQRIGRFLDEHSG